MRSGDVSISMDSSSRVVDEEEERDESDEDVGLSSESRNREELVVYL